MSQLARAMQHQPLNTCDIFNNYKTSSKQPIHQAFATDMQPYLCSTERQSRSSNDQALICAKARSPITNHAIGLSASELCALPATTKDGLNNEHCGFDLKAESGLRMHTTVPHKFADVEHNVEDAVSCQ